MYIYLIKSLCLYELITWKFCNTGNLYFMVDNIWKSVSNVSSYATFHHILVTNYMRSKEDGANSTFLCGDLEF